MTQQSMPASSALPKNTRLVEGDVFEVLRGFGLAHIRTDEGAIVCLNKGTPGVDNFDLIAEGQRWRCTVVHPYSRVTFAQQLS